MAVDQRFFSSMKMHFLERAFKYCPSSILKIIQEMLQKMVLKKKVGSRLRLVQENI